MSQQDPNFKLGRFYYFSVMTSTPNTNVSMQLYQKQTVQLLQDRQPILNFMNTPFDLVKYYQLPFLSSTSVVNCTISLNFLTPGFQPSFYLMKNDIYNGSFSQSTLVYPSLANFTLQQQASILSSSKEMNNFTFLIQPPTVVKQNMTYVTKQNMTVNQTILANVTYNITNTTTKKNQTVTGLRNVTVMVN